MGNDELRGRGRSTASDGEYKLSLSPRYWSAYLRTPFDLVVSAESVEQPTIVKLRPAAIVDLTVVDADTGQFLMGVDVWLEARSRNVQPYRREHGYLQLGSRDANSPTTKRRNGQRRQNKRSCSSRATRDRGRPEDYPQGYVPAEPDGKLINYSRVWRRLSSLHSASNRRPYRHQASQPSNCNRPAAGGSTRATVLAAIAALLAIRAAMVTGRIELNEQQ